MHRSNNAVIMQTEQLGRIEALEEELRSSRGKVAEMEQKMMEQDRVRVRLPWVIYSHPNSRGSTSTTGVYPPVMLHTA